MNRNEKNRLIKYFSKTPFWDCDVEKLDCKENKLLIIERVIVYGNEKDEKLLFKMYSLREIRNNVKKSNSLNESVINYLCVVLNLKKEQFHAVQKYRYI